MIQISKLQKKYGKKVVLKDVSFQATPGECVAIIGTNGCGKTTLLQILAGCIKANGGTITFFGKEATGSKVFRKYCGYVPQENPLLEELSVKDNLRLWGGKDVLKQQEFLKEFNLDEILNVPVSKLSGGMKRRLSIACAFLFHPPILILDEPTSALDLYYKGMIQDWLQKYKEMKGIVVMATHDEQEILSADRCLLMKEGALVELDKSKLTAGNIKEYIKTNS